MSRKNKETTIKDLIEVFLPKLWIILLVGVLLAGIMSVYSIFIKKDTYTASAEIYVYKSSNSTSTSTTTGDIAAAEEMVNIYERAIGGDDFMEHVCLKLKEKNAKYEYIPAQLKSMITMTKVEDTPNFIIKVTTGDRELSADIADVIVNESIAVGKLEEIIRNNHKSSIIESPKSANEISANSKNTVRNAIIAFLAGVILSAVCIWIFASFDVTIRSQKKIEDLLDVPVLGVIPRHDVTTSTEVKQ